MERVAKLYYWRHRCLRMPVNYLLEHLRVPYDMVYYSDPEHWLPDKARLIEEGFLTPNLPYFESAQGDKMSETMAILHALASQYKPELVPKSPSEYTQVIMIEGMMVDYMMAVTMPFYDCKTLEKANAEMKGNLERFRSKTDFFEGVLAEGHWVLGEKLSFLDFYWVEIVEKLVIMEEELKQGFFGADTLEVFRAYVARFAELDGIKEFRASPRFIKRPFHNVLRAVWV